MRVYLVYVSGTRVGSKMIYLVSKKSSLWEFQIIFCSVRLALGFHAAVELGKAQCND